MNTNVKLMIVFSKLSQTFLSSLGKNLEELGMAGSTYPILAHLNEVDRAKTQRLGEVAVITSGSITHIVNKLCKQGYATKEQDTIDKRIFWVKITETGRSAYQKVNNEHIKYLNSLLADFTYDEKIEFIEQIKYFGKTIQNNIDEEK